MYNHIREHARFLFLNFLFKLSLIGILAGLEKNKFLTSLHLKVKNILNINALQGNNIRNSGTQALAKLLRHNKHLQNLYLEWNGLGIFPEAFSLFCEGLIFNTSLQKIDLSNNQLNHVCAQHIANVLLNNSSIKYLDLRWNNFGLFGGQALLNSMPKNRTILTMLVTGNDIPMDTIQAIEAVVSAAAKRYLSDSENISKANYFAMKLKAKEQEKNEQVRLLISELERKEEETMKSEKFHNEKFAETKEALEDKLKDCDNLISKVRELENEIWVISEENKKLKFSLSVQEDAFRKLNEEYKDAMKNVEKNREASEKELLNKFNFFQQENIHLKQEVQELRNINLSLTEQNELLLLKIMKIKENLSDERTSYERKISSLKDLHINEIKALKSNAENESARLKEEFQSAKLVYEQKVSHLESMQEELQKELKSKSLQLLDMKSQVEKEKIETEKKLTMDHASVLRKMEERIHLLEDANKEQYDRIQDDIQEIHKLKVDITNLDLNLSEQDHEIENLRKLLEEKDKELAANDTKVKLEVREKLEELEKCKIELQEKCEEIKSLHISLKEKEEKYTETIESKDKEIKKLEEKVHKLKKKLKEMLELDKRRTRNLQEAFETFTKSEILQPEVILNDKSI